MMAQKGVQTLHPTYEAAAAKWRRCRDLSTGEAAIHAGGTLYLAKLAEETDADYKKRLARSPVFNAFWRTISGLRGMLFRKPAQIDAPAGLDAYLDDVDMAGSPLQTFAQKVVEESLTVGRVAILADYPQQAGEGVTVAMAQSMGLRPSLQIYQAETLINWRVDRIGNASVLALAVLTEQARVTTDEYSHDSEARYRVLDLFNGVYRQRVYRINDKGDDEQVGEDVFPLMQGQPMRFIPLSIVGVDSIGTEIEEPPLNDLVDMNLHHYAVGSDYEHGCHFSGLPSLFISGHRPDQENKIYIGGPTANCLPDPSARAYFVEIASNFEALRLNLEDKKSQMAVLGARMLEVQRAGVESAEVSATHRKGEESQLAAMAQTVSQGISLALTWLAAWAGASGEVEYELNRDFVPVRMGPQELTALVTAWQTGAVSGQTLFDNLQRGEIIKPGIEYEEEQARIGESAPVMVAPLVEGGE
jgi:hypothetical protein